MSNTQWSRIALRVLLVALASMAPIAFPLSQMGIASLFVLAKVLVLPAALMLLILVVVLSQSSARDLTRLVVTGCLAGLAATVALEVVRYTGFKLGYMPGNLPRLMGVLLLDRFAIGPSTGSDVAGFTYHFWNGACFGAIFALLGASLSRSWAILYGLAIGLGFLVSPVVQALGVGLFGKDFGWHFAATVLLAHAAFGSALALLLPGQTGRSAVTKPLSTLAPSHSG
jgi:hypothetical protein